MPEGVLGDAKLRDKISSFVITNVLAYLGLFAIIILGGAIISLFGDLGIRSRKLALLLCLIVGFATIAVAHFAFKKWLEHREAIAAWSKKAFSRKPAEASFRLVFKSNEAAFQYACTFLNCRLEAGAVLPALILDGSNLWNEGTPVLQRPNGRQLVSVLVAGDDGGFRATGFTVGGGRPLQVGDLVAWRADAYLREIETNVKDPRAAWCGVITYILEPTYLGYGWRQRESFSTEVADSH